MNDLQVFNEEVWIRGLIHRLNKMIKCQYDSKICMKYNKAVDNSSKASAYQIASVSSLVITGGT